MNTARDDMLDRIRLALHDVPPMEQPGQVAVTRDYLHTDPHPEDMVERFVERVREYKAIVHQVAQDEVAIAIAAACAARGAQQLIIPADLPEAWRPAGVELIEDDELSYAQLDTSDGVLTGCALGIAQTGTIVLDSGPAQGRRAISLVPDYHICVVCEDQIMGLVPEAITHLGEGLHATQRPITFISGPSATSDIELNRVEGVHGPRTLEVFVVG